MKPGWTAGVTRGRLLLDRMLGPEQARAIATRPSLDTAVSAIAASAYGERVRPQADLVSARRGVADTLLWHLRVLAGWLPPTGAGLIRALAAWFELQNIDARVAALVGDGRQPPPFALGALATAWPTIDRARTIDDLIAAVARSAWGDPGGHSPAELVLGLRVQWARRVLEAAPRAGDWVAGAGALLVARELFVEDSRARAVQLRRLPGIGERPLAAASLDELRGRLGPDAAWALAETTDPGELWRAELGWWSRVESEAIALLRRWDDVPSVLGAVACLGADAQRVARALETAARGGDPALVELVDAAH